MENPVSVRVKAWQLEPSPHFWLTITEMVLPVQGGFGPFAVELQTILQILPQAAPLSHIASLTEAMKTSFGPYDIGVHEVGLSENKEKVLQVNYLGFFFLSNGNIMGATSESK